MESRWVSVFGTYYLISYKCDKLQKNLLYMQTLVDAYGYKYVKKLEYNFHYIITFLWNHIICIANEMYALGIVFIWGEVSSGTNDISCLSTAISKRFFHWFLSVYNNSKSVYIKWGHWVFQSRDCHCRSWGQIWVWLLLKFSHFFHCKRFQLQWILDIYCCTFLLLLLRKLCLNLNDLIAYNLFCFFDFCRHLWKSELPKWRSSLCLASDWRENFLHLRKNEKS